MSVKKCLIGSAGMEEGRSQEGGRPGGGEAGCRHHMWRVADDDGRDSRESEVMS